jgi:hypothetical protein
MQECVVFLLLSFLSVRGRLLRELRRQNPESQHEQDRAQEDSMFLHVGSPFDTRGQRDNWSLHPKTRVGAWLTREPWSSMQRRKKRKKTKEKNSFNLAVGFSPT